MGLPPPALKLLGRLLVFGPNAENYQEQTLYNTRPTVASILSAICVANHENKLKKDIHINQQL